MLNEEGYMNNISLKRGYVNEKARAEKDTVRRKDGVGA